MLLVKGTTMKKKNYRRTPFAVFCIGPTHNPLIQYIIQAELLSYHTKRKKTKIEENGGGGRTSFLDFVFFDGLYRWILIFTEREKIIQEALCSGNPFFLYSSNDLHGNVVISCFGRFLSLS